MADEETRLRCTRCGREYDAEEGTGPLCPACAQQDELDSEHESVAAHLNHSTPVTLALIGANLAFFVAVLATGGSSTENLLRWGANFGPMVFAGEWWRMVTAAFLHASVAHIAFNMLALWSLGPLLERLAGRWPFLLLYLCCAVGGSAASLWWHPTVVGVGASGAIFGLAGALLSFQYLKQLPLPREYLKKNAGNVALFVFYNLIIGAVARTVDNAAHVGGLVSGAALGSLMIPAFARHAGWRRYLAFPAFALLLVGGARYASGSHPGISEYATGARLLQEEKFAEAAPHLQKAVDADPNNADAQFHLGYALIRLDRPQEAAKAMKEAVRLMPNDFAAHFNLGLVYMDLKRWDDAIPQFEAALQQRDDARARYYLGICYLTTNRKRQAAEALAKSLEMDPRADYADLARRALADARGENTSK